MKPQEFTAYLRSYLGDVEMPLAFWYGKEAVAEPEKTRGCYIKDLRKAREGNPMSLNAESIGCGGGKLYTGFSTPPPFVPAFVSQKERYKKTPEMVEEFINGLDIELQTDAFLNFVRVDHLKIFDNVEGILFFAKPDLISGLVSWAYFDTNQDNAVSVPFGSGCSSLIAQVVKENRTNGKRSFLGLFDPSVRPHVEPDILSFAIPFSRFEEMYKTLPFSCLNDTYGWNKVKERIHNNKL